MFEVLGLVLLVAGTVILTLGLLWLVWQGAKSHWWLGALLFFTMPVGPLVFGLIRFRQSTRPLICVLLGIIVGAMPFAYGRGYEYLFGLGERERMIDGERHLTLTGWDRPNYEILTRKLDTVVLEIGNPNVNDSTLEQILKMNRLRELTLNDSVISDSGLQSLKKLPALKSLRVARTKITKEGVTSFLAEPPPSLLEIDVSGNSIPASALRKWKNQDAEHRRYVN